MGKKKRRNRLDTRTQKPAPDVRNSAAIQNRDDEQLHAKPPESLRVLLWLILHGREYWRYLVLVAVFILSTWLLTGGWQIVSGWVNARADSDLLLVDLSRKNEEAEQPALQSTPEEDRRAWQPEFPTLDFKFANTSGGIVFIKAISIVVEESRLDPTPVLDSGNRFDSSGNMTIYLRNRGWGQANNVVFRPLAGGVTKYLVPEAVQTIWRGNLLSGGEADVVISKKWILPEVSEQSAVRLQNNNGIVSYQDVNGSTSEHKVSWGELEILGPEQGFQEVFVSSSLGRFDPSARYNISLASSDFPFTNTYTISHKIESNDVDRFQVTFSSVQSSFYTITFKFHYNEDQVLETPSRDIHIWNPLSRNASDFAKMKSIQPFGRPTFTVVDSTLTEAWTRFVREVIDENASVFYELATAIPMKLGDSGILHVSVHSQSEVSRFIARKRFLLAVLNKYVSVEDMRFHVPPLPYVDQLED